MSARKVLLTWESVGSKAKKEDVTVDEGRNAIWEDEVGPLSII